MTATATRPPVADYDRSPPNDAYAEQCVLGGMMIGTNVVGDVAEIVTVDDFYHAKHRTIYATIVSLYANGDPTDPVAVSNELTRQGDLDRIGGVVYLHELVQVVPTAANATFYAGIIAERAVFRRVIEAGQKLVQVGYGTGTTAEQAVDLAQKVTFELTNRRRRSDAVPFADLIQPTLDGIEASAAHGGTLRGVPTGFTDLDNLLKGSKGGQLILVAGRPGQGKSTAAVGFAVHAAARHGLTAAVFSLEMSHTEITERIMSSLCRIPLDVIQSGALTDDDWTRLARGLGEFGAMPLHIDDSADLTLMELRTKARRLKAQHDLQLLVVDYIQLMPTTGRSESREREIAEISRGLKLLAKEIDIPIIGVAQLNRESEQRGDKRPQLSDLRGSGSLEQDADIVILVHRDDYYDKESPRAGEADFIVAKHRNGPTDTITVAAQLHLSRFVDMAIG